METTDMEENTLEERGVHLLMGEVDDEKCEDAIRFILKENFLKRHEMLSLLINSGGGDTGSGFSLVDVIAGSKVPVKTVGLGTVASMALMVFITGAKGHRTLTPNTMIMSHQFSWAHEGKQHELLASMKANDILKEVMVNHYKKHTRLKTGDIHKYLLPASDVWLTAKEAKRLNLCDVIQDFPGG